MVRPCRAQNMKIVLVSRRANIFMNGEPCAETETDTGFTLTREAVRDFSTPFALLTTIKTTSW
jgi:hypothetical protein